MTGEGGGTSRGRKWSHFRSEDMSGVDDATARSLIRQHGRLVRYLARRYAPPSHTLAPSDIDDLRATGAVVLIQAWVRFDPDRGMQFSSWAAVQIHRAFAAMRREAVHGSSRVTGEDPPPRMVAFDVPHPLAGDEALPLSERIAAPPQGELDDRLRWVVARLRVLTPREQHVLLLAMKDTSLVEIGRHLGVTRQRVEQILRSATDRLAWLAWHEGLTDGPEPERGAPAAMRGKPRWRPRDFRTVAGYAAP